MNESMRQLPVGRLSESPLSESESRFWLLGDMLGLDADASGELLDSLPFRSLPSFFRPRNG